MPSMITDKDTFGRAQSLSALKSLPRLPNFTSAKSLSNVFNEFPNDSTATGARDVRSTAAQFSDAEGDSSREADAAEDGNDQNGRDVKPTRLFASQSTFSLSRQPSLSTSGWNTRLFGSGRDTNSGLSLSATSGRNRSCSDLLAMAMVHHIDGESKGCDDSLDSDFDVSKDGDSSVDADLEDTIAGEQEVGCAAMNRSWDSSSSATLALNCDVGDAEGGDDPDGRRPGEHGLDIILDTRTMKAPECSIGTELAHFMHSIRYSPSRAESNHESIFAESRGVNEPGGLGTHAPNSFSEPKSTRARIYFAPEDVCSDHHHRRSAEQDPFTTVTTPHPSKPNQQAGTGCDPALIGEGYKSAGNAAARFRRSSGRSATEQVHMDDVTRTTSMIVLRDTADAFQQLNATLSQLLVHWCKVLAEDSSLEGLSDCGKAKYHSRDATAVHLEWCEKIVMGSMIIVVAQILMVLALAEKGYMEVGGRVRGMLE